MADFCERCPDRGSCEGAIESMEVMSSYTEGRISANRRSTSTLIEHGDLIGPTDATIRYIDAEGGASEAIAVRGSSSDDAKNKGLEHVGNIDRCTGPKVTKFLGVVVK